MSERLIKILARAGTAELKPLVGSSTIALLERIGSPAISPTGLAELIVSQAGAAGVLRSRQIRAIALGRLDPGEKESLCSLLGYPSGDTTRTLNGAPFDRVESLLEHLFSWFAVPFETEDQLDEDATRRAPPAHKLHDHQRIAFRDLRRRLAEPGSATLLHMPVGAGKLRIAATALVDLFRSEPDGSVMLWLAHDPALCSQAFDELDDAWRRLGSRDVTLFRHYGRHGARDLDKIEDGIVVADVRYLARDASASALGRLGNRVRAVVLNEVQQVDAAAYRHVLGALGCSRPYALVGLSAASGSAIRATGKDAALKAVFASERIALPFPDPINHLRSEGLLGRLDLDEQGPSTGAPLSLEDGDLDVSEEALSALANDPERNTRILERLQSEVDGGANVALFATSAAQAKMFVGVLALSGIHAVAVTEEMSRERQQQAMLEYQNRDRARVLCVHGIFVTGRVARKTTVALIARPTTSPMVYSHMIGRLAGGTSEEACEHLKVVTLLADVPGFREMIASFSAWDDL